MLFRQFFDTTSSTYTYLIANKKGAEACIIDPVLEHIENYLKAIKDLDLKLVKVIDTHVHADHVSGISKLRDKTQCIACMGKSQNASEIVSMEVSDNEKFKVGDLELRALFTPGHTDDSYCFLLNNKIFTGDTLLIGGTGRTDFQNGNAEDQYNSLFNVVLKLDDSVLVYPAHDYKGETVTTIGFERKTNPRLQVKSKQEYVDLMSSLNLPNPKLMDIVVPKNRKHGVPLEIQMQFNGINVQQLKTMMNQKKVKLIDVREDFEIQRDGLIEKSIQVPYTQIENFFQNIELSQSTDQFVLYCHSGQRTYLALQKLKNSNIYHLAGGILNWLEAGESVQRT
ncbi:MAG TPA: MBL fold metallo-hydrolase [Pelagibacteraceae bacterium]|jgi:glyoxylase-like metal-dependent hydrolase (beta-lactamase superfamily II)/rhodanese-related sulfurtransferase|nr:MBL fold metallo-hydrolase [Pelagibacteraceae bacterium]